MASKARELDPIIDDNLEPDEWFRLRLQQIAQRLDESEAAKKFVGEVVETGHQPVGVVRGVAHNVEGLVGTGKFVGRLLNPMDREMSPSGESASEQLGAAIGNSLNGWRYVVSNPRDGARIVGELSSDFYKSIEPSATPMAPTLVGEANRRAEVALNQGELAFDVLSLLRAGPALKGVAKVGAAKPLTDAEYAAAKFTPQQILAMNQPYTRLGHHVVPRRWTKGLPEVVRNHPAILLAPAGISRRKMNELHYRVDPHFHGAKAPVDPAGPRGWSGKKLGIEKYGLLNRLAFGTPGYANAVLLLNALGIIDAPQPSGARNGRGTQNLR
jgi:hypothetical protein